MHARLDTHPCTGRRCVDACVRMPASIPLPPAGYYGVGPVCWKKCDAGWTDTGTSCQQWASSYGKGCCCTIFSRGCCHNCMAGYTDTGCTCYRAPKTYTKSR